MEDIMIVPVTATDGTAGYTGMLGGQGAGDAFSPVILGLPPLSVEQHIVK